MNGCRPFGTRVGRRIEVNYATPIVTQDQETEQHPKGGRWNHEEIDGHKSRTGLLAAPQPLQINPGASVYGAQSRSDWVDFARRRGIAPAIAPGAKEQAGSVTTNAKNIRVRL